MNKILPLLITALCCTANLNSQAKRYIWLEHFTNTNCGSCAFSNPGFFNLLKGYKDQYHHLSVHPDVPYPQCVLYNANKEEQLKRKNYYGITGTPTVMIQGIIKRSAGSITSAMLDAEKVKTSPITVSVSEMGNTSRTVNVKVTTVGSKPGSNYRLYAAIAERQLDLATPNGEKVHHNVFRKFLTSADGDLILLADTGNGVERTFNYTVDSKWKESETYVVVWVQDAVTKEVLNSGTKFDLTSGVQDKLAPVEFSIYPNPVIDQLNIQFDKPLQSVLNLYITNVLGKTIQAMEVKAGQAKITVPVAHYQKGIYFVRIDQGKNKLARKWLKD